MPDFIKNRRSNLFNLLAEEKVEALLISQPENITYLTGVISLSHHHKEVFALVTDSRLILIVSPLIAQSFSQIPGIELITIGPGAGLIDSIKAIISESTKQLHLETKDLTYAQVNKIKTELKIKIKSGDDLVERLRQIKDKQEITQIKRACQITVDTYHQIREQIEIGQTEQQIARLIRNLQESNGADGLPFGFAPIVAFGQHTAIPHHKPSDRPLKQGDPILLDFGCQVGGYASDFTRTFCLGKPSQTFLKLEKLVQAAYQAGFEYLKANVLVSDSDKAVRQIFDQAKMSQYYPHTAGHGLGLAIHESPSLYQRNTDQKLSKNMTLTLEPGLYISGEVGYRYENTLVIGREKAINLTKAD